MSSQLRDILNPPLVFIRYTLLSIQQLLDGLGLGSIE